MSSIPLSFSLLLRMELLWAHAMQRSDLGGHKSNKKRSLSGARKPDPTVSPHLHCVWAPGHAGGPFGLQYVPATWCQRLEWLPNLFMLCLETWLSDGPVILRARNTSIFIPCIICLISPSQKTNCVPNWHPFAISEPYYMTLPGLLIFLPYLVKYTVTHLTMVFNG